MKEVRYTSDAARELKRHGNVAQRIRKAMVEHASGSGAHANNIKQLSGLSCRRMRVGDYRVIFEEGDTVVLVTKVAPRGSAYD